MRADYAIVAKYSLELIGYAKEQFMKYLNEILFYIYKDKLILENIYKSNEF
jgi:hypothetical protein